MIVAYWVIQLLELMQWLLVFRALASWFPQVQQSRLGEVLYMVTEPIVAPIRSLLDRFQSSRPMMLDFSSIIAYFVLLLLQVLLRNIIYGLY